MGAYHPSRKASTPPASEWNVPHDGPIDHSFTVTADRDATLEAAPTISQETDSKTEKDDTKLDGAHNAFVAAYNKRREERIAEESKEREEKTKEGAKKGEVRVSKD